MSGVASGSASDSVRDDMRRDIIAFIQNEIQDRNIVLTMETPTSAVVIDSLDIARVLFRVEEKYGGEFTSLPDSVPRTVGDLVDLLIDSIRTTNHSG